MALSNLDNFEVRANAKLGVKEFQIQSTVTETRTLKPTTILLPSSTIFTTITETFVDTVTIAPHASSTTTILSTIISSFSTVVTQSVTSTSTQVSTYTTTVSSYAACATNNILGPTLPNGNIIDNVYNDGVNNPSIFTLQTTADAYDCCVQCITASDCTSSAFSNGECLLLQNSASTCGDQSSNPGFYVSEAAGQGGETTYVLSNGNCGYLYDGGLST